MSKGIKLTAALANQLVAAGFKAPIYPKPKWYQLVLRRKLAYYRKNNWPYRLEEAK